MLSTKVAIVIAIFTLVTVTSIAKGTPKGNGNSNGNVNKNGNNNGNNNGNSNANGNSNGNRNGNGNGNSNGNKNGNGNGNSNRNGTMNGNNANKHDGKVKKEVPFEVGGVADSVVLNRGRKGGHEKEVKEKIEREKADKREKEMDHVEEQNLLDRQMEFTGWLEDCEKKDDISKCKPFSDGIRKLMEENNMDEEDVKKRRNANKNARKKSKRHKRSYMLAGSGIWDKCIIPYKWDASLPDNDKEGISKAHGVYEKWTGFRFAYYTGNNSALGLPHENHLIYKRDTKGCRSYVGNLRGNGQSIWACGGGSVAVHEIGHALGMMHEQKLPGSFPSLSMKYQNQKDQYRSQYYRSSLKSIWNDGRPYDMSSTMHYGLWDFHKNYAKTQVPNDPDVTYLIGSGNTFYMFKTLQEYHNCYAEFPSCDTKPVCEMGGYESVIDGKCSCRCPDGLDSATNCTTRYAPTYPTTMPNGTHSTLKVKDKNCSAEYAEGNMVHWASSWVWNGGQYNSPGYIDGREISHDTCTKTTSAGSGPWSPGEYCILRYGGVCPDGFENGTIETYGNVQLRNGSTGVVPDGQHDRFFEYKFCCRNDGDYRTPISLPVTNNFILYYKSNQGCQKVEGMNSKLEFYVMRSDYSALNVNITGQVPYIYKFSNSLHNCYYCVYFPLNRDCGEVKMFTNETSYTISSPGYPNNYSPNMECEWHFKSPEGTKMQLDFASGFEVSSESDSSCKSYIEVKFVLPGMPGYKFCGHNYRKTTWTLYNYLTIKFVSDVSSTSFKGFQATIQIYKDEALCYTKDGIDGSYAGPVNYTKSLEPCLPWAEVAHCPYAAFDSRTAGAGLTLHNYCRNVVLGTQPWCYTNSELCERQNCDACMSGSCYDMDDDCAARLAADSNFCSSNENGEAHHKCMETCGKCESHSKKSSVNAVTCSAPADVRGIAALPVNDTYKVGDVVTYTCPSTKDKRTRTCTSEGKWTHLNFVCSACRTDWAIYGQKCFKWLGWEVNLNFESAKNACADLDAHVITVDSVEVQQFMDEIVNYDKEQVAVAWIGLEANESRAWHWQDGTPLNYSNWNSGEPNNYGAGEDCVISKYSKWYDYPCGEEKHKFEVVCEYAPTATPIECLDQLDDCEQILKTFPKMCQTQTSFAWHNCRKTCGVGECKPQNTRCNDDANLSYRGQRVHGSCTIAVGEYVQHQCNVGYFHTNGDLTRACLPSGSLTGTPPTCSIPEVTSSVNQFVDKANYRRSVSGTKQYSLILANNTNQEMMFNVEGMVTSWTFYSNYVGTVSFQLWRPTNVTNTYQFAGQNVITTVEDRKYTARINETDQLHAQVGDLVGIWQNSGELSYTKCRSTITPEHGGWFQTSSSVQASQMVVGSNHLFKVSETDCRIYSLKATVNPSGVCST